MELLEWSVAQLKWLLGLAKPENLKELVTLGGHWWVGYAVLTAIVFSETGLLIGFFLPGDSLLFTAGFLSSQSVFNITGLTIILCIAAVVGDAVNYFVGSQMTEHVFEKGRLRFVKHEHLLAAKHFYEKHGGKAIVLARFVPIVRTFTPFVAGVAQMSYPQFFIYNFFGGIGWVISMTQAGYWLGRVEIIAKNFEITVLAIIFISVLPIVFEVIKHRRNPRNVAEDIGVISNPDN
ncbi:MAG: VTT domain-containing protein [Planctomycetota bacterium]